MVGGGRGRKEIMTAVSLTHSLTHLERKGKKRKNSAGCRGAKNNHV